MALGHPEISWDSRSIGATKGVLDVLAASPEAPGTGSEEWQQALIDLIDATGSGAFDMEKLRERAEVAKFYRCV